MKKDGTEQNCQACEKSLKPGAYSSICPGCLLEGISGVLLANPVENLGDFIVPLPEDLELIFPEFSLRRLVGRGGMGAVYEAFHEELERTVALKILPEETAQDLEFRERFRQEAKTLAQLDHPNIVGLFDFGERQGYFYIAMEFVEGKTLSSLMEGKPMELAFVLPIVDQLCKALSYSHKNGVVHRDIKPANILLDESGVVKIVDFGLAKIVRGPEFEWGLTRTQATMGTPQYMAPEQFSKTSEVDHRADVYSVGVLLYELLTGKIPVGNFEKPSKGSREVPRRYDAVILKALHRDPEQRFQDVRELAHELHRKDWRVAVFLAVVAMFLLGAWMMSDQEDEIRAIEPRVEVSYQAKIGDDPNPIHQGWTASEIQVGEDGNARAEVVDGETVWRIDDHLTEESLNLPAYYYYPENPEGIVPRLFEKGWEFSFTYRIEEQTGGSDYAAFCGWRISGKLAPKEWGIPEGKSARMGFYLGRSHQWTLLGRKYAGYFVSRDLQAAPQLGQERRSNAFMKKSEERGEWHTVRVIGEPRSPRYDWYVDGEYAGSGRISDEIKGDTEEALHLLFYSGSPGEIDRTSDWREVTLMSGVGEAPQ